jgi:nucleotide-binding universal stress UspA family protein
MSIAFERHIHHVLIAVDESDSSRRAVSYVADMLKGIKAFNILLLHIINEPEEDFFPSAPERENWITEKKLTAEAILKGDRDLLVQKGFDPGHVFAEVKVQYCPSIAECILKEAESSQSKTIVVGRKGVSRKEEFLFGSVSNRIIHQAKNCTVWVVE